VIERRSDPNMTMKAGRLGNLHDPALHRLDPGPDRAEVANR
jgi:hypothetical protein